MVLATPVAGSGMQDSVPVFLVYEDIGTEAYPATRHCNLFINEEMNISHSSALLGSGTNDTAHANHEWLDKTELGQGRKDKKVLYNTVHSMIQVMKISGYLEILSETSSCRVQSEVPNL